MKHILYAEDRDDDVFFLRRACKRAGLQDVLAIHSVADGQLAIDYLSGAREFANRLAHPLPDLVLLDLKMPNRSGLEVLEWIRNQSAFAPLPTFLLSSSNQQSDMQRATQLGATGYFTKPTVISELSNFIAELAGRLGIETSAGGLSSTLEREPARSAATR